MHAGLAFLLQCFLQRAAPDGRNIHIERRRPEGECQEHSDSSHCSHQNELAHVFLHETATLSISGPRPESRRSNFLRTSSAEKKADETTMMNDQAYVVALIHSGRRYSSVCRFRASSAQAAYPSRNPKGMAMSVNAACSPSRRTEISRRVKPRIRRLASSLARSERAMRAPL